jgi:RNA processing factor Prp31
LSEVDTQQLAELSAQAVKTIDFKKEIAAYLAERMGEVCPNLTKLIGENVPQ